jgi:hypothetical protein
MADQQKKQLGIIAGVLSILLSLLIIYFGVV